MYKRSTETKIIRVTHKVSFEVGTRVIDLISSLQKVPPTCHITEFDVDEAAGITDIKFREDRAEEVNP